MYHITARTVLLSAAMRSPYWVQYPSQRCSAAWRRLFSKFGFVLMVQQFFRAVMHLQKCHTFLAALLTYFSQWFGVLSLTANTCTYLYIYSMWYMLYNIYIWSFKNIPLYSILVPALILLIDLKNFNINLPCPTTISPFSPLPKKRDLFYSFP